MAEHWQCPSCKTIFEKSVFEALEQFYEKGVPVVFGSSLHCPVCKHPIDPQALLDGEYDHQLVEKPPRKKLQEEAEKLFIQLMFKETRDLRKKGIYDPEAVVKNATNQTGDYLFNKYGLTQNEIIDIMEKVLESL
ncbi:hypothetical protein ACX8XP_12960 [Calditrichota bacterium LG25]